MTETNDGEWKRISLDWEGREQDEDEEEGAEAGATARVRDKGEEDYSSFTLLKQVHTNTCTTDTNNQPCISALTFRLFISGFLVSIHTFYTSNLEEISKLRIFFCFQA